MWDDTFLGVYPNESCKISHDSFAMSVSLFVLKSGSSYVTSGRWRNLVLENFIIHTYLFWLSSKYNIHFTCRSTCALHAEITEGEIPRRRIPGAFKNSNECPKCYYAMRIFPNMFKWLSFYTAVHSRRQFWTSYSPPWELKISHV
jgi:hypothetical protein